MGTGGTLYPQVQDLYPLYPPSQRRDLCQNFKQTTLTTRLYKVRTNLYLPPPPPHLRKRSDAPLWIRHRVQHFHVKPPDVSSVSRVKRTDAMCNWRCNCNHNSNHGPRWPQNTRCYLVTAASDTTIWTASAGLFYDQHRVARFLTSHDEILETCPLVHLMPDKCIYMIPQAYILATSYKLHKLTSGRQENGAKIQDLPGNPGTTGCCQLQYPMRFSLFLGVGVIQAKSGSSPTLRGG